MTRILSVLCASALVVGSLMPLAFKTALHITSNHRFTHTAVHVASFTLLGALLTGLAKSQPQRLAALTTAVSFGLLLELLENLVYHQPLEFSDALFDACGGAFGFVICLRLTRSKSDVEL